MTRLPFHMLLAAGMAILPVPARAQAPATLQLQVPSRPVPPAPQPQPEPAMPPAINAETGEVVPPRQQPAEPPISPPAPRSEVKPAPGAPVRPARLTELPAHDNPSFAPGTYAATLAAADFYARIADAGGWPQLARQLKPGDVGTDVVTLRQRLYIEGDTESDSAATLFDEGLKAAVMRFQERHGILRSGIVGTATLKALNVPARERQIQLQSSAGRIAASNFPFGERYIAVNIPSASVEAVEGGRVVRRYTAVVGDTKHQSPEVEARIGAVNLNPTWTVPVSIIRNEIIPKMRKDPRYLARNKIRVLDQSGTPVDPATIDWTTNKATNYTLRQDSGTHNSLGQIRIAMPNKHAVYLHDTPSKHAFGRDDRFLSHGCVRVQDVADLAEWLLAGVKGGAWTAPAIKAAMAIGTREDIRLPQPVPVVWVYLTGWADPDGRAHFRADVYKRDEAPGAPRDLPADPIMVRAPSPAEARAIPAR